MSIKNRFRVSLSASLFFLTTISVAHAQYSGGSGTAEDPYQIATAADLIALGETPDDYDKHFILTADIDLDPYLPGRRVFERAVIAPDTDPDRNWFQGTWFGGVFDGNGHRISHLTISGVSYLGLFGGIGGYPGMISNLGLETVDVHGVGHYVGGLVGHNDGTLTQCYSSGSVSGDWDVGGLVGVNGGSITTSHSASTVTADSVVGGLVGRNDRGSVISSCSTGVVSGSTWVGGLVGANGGNGGNGGNSGNSGKITKCYSTSTVRGSSSVGGLVGVNNVFLRGYPLRGFIDLSYSTGMVTGTEYVGGFVGTNPGEVSNCYSTSAVSGDNPVGGLVGANFVVYMGYGSATYVAGGSLTHCYSMGIVGGTGENVGGLVGSNKCEDQAGRGVVSESLWDTQTSGHSTSDGGIGTTTAEMQTGSTFLEAGWDFVGETENATDDVWKIVEDHTYPLLSWQKYSGGTGEPNDPYQIATAADLIALGETPEDYDKHFLLTADIDLDPNLPGRKVFDKAVIGAVTPIGVYPYFHGTPFIGVFDGNSHTILHLTIAGGWYVGLFGRLESGAEVRDLGTVYVNVAGSGDYIGGLVGLNARGSITNCCSAGEVSGTGAVGGLVGENVGEVNFCYSSGLVTGDPWVGGLVGLNNKGTVANCSSNGTVTGGSYVGGLVGYNAVETKALRYRARGLVSQCHTASRVIGSDSIGGLVGGNDGIITTSYSTGEVSGDHVVAGLVGYNNGLVSSSFWDTQASGQATSGAGTGKTTAEMQTAQTFIDAGWDFMGERENGTEDIWWILEGQDYPRLWWELIAEN